MIKAIIFDLDNTLVDFMLLKRAAVDAAINAMIDAGLNVTFEKAVEKFSVAYPGRDTAKKLLLTQNIPCIKLERTTYESERVIEYTVGIIRGDRFQFEVTLDNNRRHF